MLEAFLKILSKRRSTDAVYNQYEDQKVRNNLRLYYGWLLEHEHNVLIVGEAAGYMGCRHTGIPFTSGNIIYGSYHEIFRDIGKQIKLERVVSERSAAILWGFFGEDKVIPILWNAFPFHPHKQGQTETNRKPTMSEIEEGKEYLKFVYDIFKPKKLCSLGRVAEKALKELFPLEEIIYIRHPSYGGKRDFIKGMKRTLS